MPPITGRKCLIVLGMHRSGTSAIAGVLQLAGLDPGKNLLPPTEDNSKGFFENEAIIKVSDSILEELYARWNDTLLIPENWWKHEKFKFYSEKITTILREEFTDNKTILIKDPRISVLLPLYLDTFSEAGIEPVFLTCIRNPSEVAASLQKRNHLTREKSLLLSMDYRLKAELYSRGKKRAYISYPEFLADPLNTIISLDNSLGLGLTLDEQTKLAIQSFIDPQLKHHNLPPQFNETIQGTGSSEFFEILSTAHLRDLSSQEMITIDKIRLQFYSAVKLYNGLPENFETLIKICLDNKTISIVKTQVGYGNNAVETSFDPDVAANEIHIHPSNSIVGLMIQKIEVYSSIGEHLKDYEIKTNATFRAGNGMYIFQTELPKIVFKFQSAHKFGKILFQADYQAFGPYTDRMLFEKTRVSVEDLKSAREQVDHQLKKIDELQTALQDKKLKLDEARRQNIELKVNLQKAEDHVNHMLASWAWRTGRIITAPVRWINKMMGK